MEFTAFLAVYAAVLSTVVFVWNVYRARPKIRVKVVHGLEMVDGEYVHGAHISVQNPSAHTVHVMNVSLAYPYREVGLWDRIQHFWQFKRFPRRVGWCHTRLNHQGVDDKCPISIQPGMSHSMLVPHDVIEKILADATSRRFIAIAQDALWRDEVSSEFEYPAVTKQQIGSGVAADA